MIKKLVKYGKILMTLALIVSLTLPSYATVGAADGSAFVTKAEFDSALSDFNARLTTFEAGINSKIDSQVSSYLDRNGIWNGKEQTVSNGGKISLSFPGVTLSDFNNKMILLKKDIGICDKITKSGLGRFIWKNSGRMIMTMGDNNSGIMMSPDAQIKLFLGKSNISSAVGVGVINFAPTVYPLLPELWCSYKVCGFDGAGGAGFGRVPGVEEMYCFLDKDQKIIGQLFLLGAVWANGLSGKVMNWVVNASGNFYSIDFLDLDLWVY